jgi:thymidylate kinase
MLCSFLNFEKSIDGASSNLALQNLYPDLVIYLKMDLKTYLERKFKMTELDRLEQESTDFFKLVIDGYDSVFKLFPNIVTIPANQSIADVHKQVINHLSQIL